LYSKLLNPKYKKVKRAAAKKIKRVKWYFYFPVEVQEESMEVQEELPFF